MNGVLVSLETYTNLESLASYAHRALADTAYPDAGSLLTPVRANQMPFNKTQGQKASAKV